MHNIIQVISRHIVVASLISYSTLVIISLGFIKDLFFWREDYARIYFLYNKELFHWPYQGLQAIYYPLFLLFGKNPSGYFIVATLLYLLLALLLAFFVYRITNRKIVGFIAGLIFSCCYVGSESLFMVETAVASPLFLIMVLTLLLLYIQFLKVQTVKKYFFSLVVYLLLITLMSHRAHTLLALLILTDIIFIAPDFNRNKIISFYQKYIQKAIIRISPFIIFTAIVYYFFPRVFLWDGSRSTGKYLNFIKEGISLQSFYNLLNDFGNVIFPSTLQEIIISKISNIKFEFFVLELVLTSLILFILVSLIFKKMNRPAGFLSVAYLAVELFIALTVNQSKEYFFGIFLTTTFSYFCLYFWLVLNSAKSYRKYALFLLSCFIISYLIYHFSEYDLVHPSWHRYFIFGYPFFAGFLAIMIYFISISFSRRTGEIIGIILVVSIIGVNLIASSVSPLKSQVLIRSQNAKYFFEELKKQAPLITGNSIFYFKTAEDSMTISRYNSIIAAGMYTQDMTLAYNFTPFTGQIKFTESESDFIKAFQSGKYQNAYAFYYDKNFKLINITNYYLKGKNEKVI